MQRAPYGSFTSAVQQITNWGVVLPDPCRVASLPLGTLRPLKFVDPFVAISSNILKSCDCCSALRLDCWRPMIRADLREPNGTLAFDRAAGRMLAGTSFYIMAGGLAAEGLITGSAPDNPRKAMYEANDRLARAQRQDRGHLLCRQSPRHFGDATGIAADLYDVGASCEN